MTMTPAVKQMLQALQLAYSCVNSASVVEDTDFSFRYEEEGELMDVQATIYRMCQAIEKRYGVEVGKDYMTTYKLEWHSARELKAIQ